MAVPTEVVEHRVEHVHRYQADAALDEAARQEARLAKSVAAIALAQIVAFALQVKCLANGAGEKLVDWLRARGGNLQTSLGVVNGAQYFSAISQPRGIESWRQVDVVQVIAAGRGV